MRITKFKKYLTWNIISAWGYLCSVIGIIFLLMFLVSASNINMRADLNEIFINYIIKYVITPYISFYKFQIFVIFCLLIASRYEHNKYNENGEYGLRLFEHNEKMYSVMFNIGLFLNIMPLYVFFMILLNLIIKFCDIML